MSYFKEILTGFGACWRGMAVTIRYFVKPIVTVQYPRQKIQMTPRYPGLSPVYHRSRDPDASLHRLRDVLPYLPVPTDHRGRDQVSGRKAEAGHQVHPRTLLLQSLRPVRRGLPHHGPGVFPGISPGGFTAGRMRHRPSDLAAKTPAGRRLARRRPFPPRRTSTRPRPPRLPPRRRKKKKPRPRPRPRPQPPKAAPKR